MEEHRNHLLGIYAVTWLVYPLTQPDVVRKDGSIKKYKDNFGKLAFDKDEPFWNWFVHPIFWLSVISILSEPMDIDESTLSL